MMSYILENIFRISTLVELVITCTNSKNTTLTKGRRHFPLGEVMTSNWTT